MSDGPRHVPHWFDDPTAIAPCPCGNPPDEDCMVIEGDVPLMRWFHQECFDFLEYEMDEDELQEKSELEDQLRRTHEEEDENE